MNLSQKELPEWVHVLAIVLSFIALGLSISTLLIKPKRAKKTNNADNNSCQTDYKTNDSVEISSTYFPESFYKPDTLHGQSNLK